MSLSVTNDISQESLKAEVGFLLIKSTFSEFTKFTESALRCRESLAGGMHYIYVLMITLNSCGYSWMVLFNSPPN